MGWVSVNGCLSQAVTSSGALRSFLRAGEVLWNDERAIMFIDMVFVRPWPWGGSQRGAGARAALARSASPRAARRPTRYKARLLALLALLGGVASPANACSEASADLGQLFAVVSAVVFTFPP